MATCALLVAPGAGAQARPPSIGTGGPDSTLFTGRVVRRSDTVPIVGADVWLVTLDRHATTDSTGRFSVAASPAPVQLVQVRRLGYAVQRDTVTLVAGRATERDYALAEQAAQLDTVHATAGKEKYLSPALQAFEERRLSGQGGYFISDSVIRRNESTTLANLASSRLPGLQALYYGRAKFTRAFVSTRKQCAGLALLGSVSSSSGRGTGGCGVANCYVAIYLDGVLYFNAKMADNGVTPPDVEREFNLVNLAGIEFYPGAGTGPAGMQADDDGCGSLWLWTRER